MAVISQLFVNEAGQHNAKTIVFLHASGSSSKMWRHHIAKLKSDFHCITLDLPGHGESHEVDWTTFDDVAELLVETIKNRSHGKPHLVGLSLGGSLIFKLLEKHFDLFDRVIVDGAAHQPIKGYRRVIAAVYFMSLFKNTKLTANLMTKMMREDGVSEQDCQTFVSDLQSVSRKSFRRAMSQANLLHVNLDFSNPVFFVSGGKESETIHESHQLLAQTNSQSQCAYYPNKGHAWLFGDVESHIQLVRYFFQDGRFPATLRRFDD
ncbi:alpha/beta fold hydrolase [Streptococcus ferus]|uniref:Putative hydrolase protein n=1 Tax=Streptococcus ferus TaxID=1345 RepID=A0A2X3Y201_9STRE|nr:alpha/beta fold hydrolase [Streptococcus ferus]SQF40832.1 putative hydrolase protein [Streptococcus ferus]